MNRIAWYFDPISPFAYLQWPRVRELARRHAVDFRPVLLAGLLGHHGQKGPAEIAGKRLFTYRHVTWLARRQGVPLVFPPAHPFNPLAALRLCLAAGNTPEAITAVFDWIWAEGRAADDAAALAPLGQRLGIADVAAAIATPEVKAQLRENTEAAIAAGVFGVPSLVVDGQVFWGNDAFDFALAFLEDPGLLDANEMARLATLPEGARRG